MGHGEHLFHCESAQDPYTVRVFLGNLALISQGLLHVPGDFTPTWPVLTSVLATSELPGVAKRMFGGVFAL